ncbi:hypothetical protein [Chitinophaga polysaccharea]|uniref:hypothetical protein n=1 Tax=Chitinophaga polysaccharea TaxID=1293035 RepID=UPI001159D641|nr:hypothetical protein [Chitinophaga polysaccharea]
MEGISPQAAAIDGIFNNPELKEIFYQQLGNSNCYVYCVGDALWVMTEWPEGARITFRAVYAPHDKIEIKSTTKKRNQAIFQLDTLAATYQVTLDLYHNGYPCFRCRTTVTPKAALAFHYWPRDIMPLNSAGSSGFPEGDIYASQNGPRTGMIYFGIKAPHSGAVLYLQNLSALGNYCGQTKTSLSNTVGGTWPDIGFMLPSSDKQFLKTGKTYTISDAFIVMDAKIPANETEMSIQFMDLLAEIYLRLPKPNTQYHHWPEIAEKAWYDLEHSAGSWCQVNGHAFLNAYVCDYKTPPELMVQMAVLLPLTEYQKWNKREMKIINDLINIIPDFYDNKLNTFVRWLPAAAHRLDKSEEHKHPLVMDSWYLHHPLLNLIRLVKQGHKGIMDKLSHSLDFAIRVAHHFNYKWPVFYNMETLEVIKAETEPGKGGEKDVPGIYAKTMLLAWEVTQKEEYLEEAKRACLSLQGEGFELFYQANNTAFSAFTALKLFTLTKNEVYLNISYLCLANMFKHVWLWNCNYGFAVNYSTFFAMFPLRDAPYTAVYEETECFASFSDYLLLAEDISIPASIRLLLAEFIRYYINRANYYYPPMLPDDCIAKNTKTGEVAKELWLPIEDLQDGWAESGTVGQEVYGAGLPFTLVPHHYYTIPGESLLVYIDYPTAGFSTRGKTATFRLLGHKKGACHMRIMPIKKRKELPRITVTNGRDALNATVYDNGHLEFKLKGNQQIVISWK